MMNDEAKVWEFRLYVADKTAKSEIALNNLKLYCEKYLQDRYVIEIIDLVTKPELAAVDQILAVPTLVKKAPQPARKIIGDLSNEEKVLTYLYIRSAQY